MNEPDMRTGVEIAAAHDRDGTWPHTIPTPRRRRRAKPPVALYAPAIHVTTAVWLSVNATSPNTRKQTR